MNQDQLKQHVEAVVRPVKASNRRTLQMRQELLAHLHEVVDEEMAKDGDQASAVQAAIDRFGPPKDLSEKLQASVPRIEVLFSRFEPWGRHMTRSFWSLAFWAFSSQLILTVLVFCAVDLIIFGVMKLEMLFAFLLIVVLMPPLYLTLYAMAGAFNGVLRHPKTPRRVLVYGIAFAIYLSAGGMMLFASDGLDAYKIVYIILISLAVPAVLALGALHMRKEMVKAENDRQQTRTWRAIEL